ncbi:hypothetical protein Acr_01g0010960 [Actinidia rufa]|uniref:Uncharacterized protein n=1 Tax=Actinidia rufa TaxID=165716 RepID=A0A7J0E6J8_9ERIC|nr:hypothetical protein Acr_01g0010960 [Actinidia rufa]
MEGSPEESPLIAVHPSVEEKTNIMTLEELNALRDTYSFPSGVQVRLPDEGEIITSTRPGEVAFYEAAFPAGLRFPIHPTIRYFISLSEFRNLFSLNSNPNPDQGWLYFKARNKKVLFGGYPSNVKGWKSKFFFVSGDEWEIPEGTSRKGAARVPRTWGIPAHCNNPPRLYDDETKVFEEIFRSVEDRKSGRSGRTRFAGIQRFSVPVSGFNPNHFAGSLSLPVLRRRGRRAIICRGEKRRAPRATWVSPKIPMNKLGEKALPEIIQLSLLAMSKRVSFKKIGEKLGKAAGASSGTPVPTKGVVISDKRPGESITSSPSKKPKADDGSKGKGVVLGPRPRRRRRCRAKLRPLQLPRLLAPGKVPRLIPAFCNDFGDLDIGDIKNGDQDAFRHFATT